MVTVNKWTYCEQTTINHQVAVKYKKCIQKIDGLCKKEGARRTNFTNEVCLNLDDFEIFLAKSHGRNNEKTMDFCFAITSNNNKKMCVLVELRLNYSNFRNLHKTELDEKTKHSKDILGHTPIIFNHYYFIFSTRIKNQAHNYLRRLYLNKNIISGIDLNDLKVMYFS